MKKPRTGIIRPSTLLHAAAIILLSLSPAVTGAQGIFKNLNIRFLCDVYYATELNEANTSPILDMAVVGSKRDEFRLQDYNIRFDYRAEKIRSTLAIQNGDGPQLLTNLSAEFIHYIDQAWFGFRLGKIFWIDFGYMPNPIGLESSKPSLNLISSVSIGGYFEPANMMGGRMMVYPSEKLSMGLAFFNNYTFMDKQKPVLTNVRHEMVGFSLMYYPTPELTLSYNNSYSDPFNSGGLHKNHLFYNNLFLIYNYKDRLHLNFQTDYAGQSKTETDSVNTIYGSALSGFLAVKYYFRPWIALGGRADFFFDPHAVLSETENDIYKGYQTYCLAASFEIKPHPLVYIRAEYNYTEDFAGNYVFNDNTNKLRSCLLFTTGLNLSLK